MDVIQMSLSLHDLGLAYRKAKVDLYYSTNPSLFDIANYEDDLSKNLTRLKEQIRNMSSRSVSRCLRLLPSLRKSVPGQQLGTDLH